ncbi:YwqH-like family protein [Staphylococcus ratti]|uniref:DUF5082 family protein n=1 Tax=Staphylococcus ratti TaxID=2892440 RepID=A0ABY3PCG4_9STAP|nr:DUF5082 family protein [Staphylococcus ratti]UEX90017.1 DUF5082 family protein [Staphylococcus ratti]
MGKADILGQLSLKKTLLGTLDGKINKLKKDLSTLEWVLEKVQEHHKDFKTTMDDCNKTEISTSHWKGQTKNKSDKHREDLEKTAEEIDKKFQDAIDRLEEDIMNKKFEIQVANAERTMVSGIIATLESALV